MKKFDPAVYKKRKCECLDKCFQAFMDNGLENTGLQLLCKYCGFKTNQALYHYFESKDMIITESVQYAMIKFEREFMKKAPRSRADLKNYLEKFPRWMQKNYGEHMRLYIRYILLRNIKNRAMISFRVFRRDTIHSFII